LLKMAEEKDLAIINEDYDAAKQLKYQISKMKEVAYQLGAIEEVQDTSQPFGQ